MSKIELSLPRALYFAGQGVFLVSLGDNESGTAVALQAWSFRPGVGDSYASRLGGLGSAPLCQAGRW